MAERSNENEMPFLQYLVPEVIPGLPCRGRPCPSPADMVTSYFNGSPPTFETGFYADTNESLNRKLTKCYIIHTIKHSLFTIGYPSSESLFAPLNPMPQESIRPSHRMYGAINNDFILGNGSRTHRIPRSRNKGMKITFAIILLATFLFYAIGQGFMIYMKYDLAQMIHVMSIYKYYIIVSYIGAIMTGFVFGWFIHQAVQKRNQESQVLTRSESMALNDLNQQNVY